MSKYCHNRYSVYHRVDETPVIIFATANECAAAMKCNVNTFYAYLSRFNKGKPYPKKYLIYEDEMDEEEKEDLRVHLKLSEKDYEIILALAPGGVKQAAVAKRFGLDTSTIHHRIERILRITGLDPRKEADLKKLVQLAKERKT